MSDVSERFRERLCEEWLPQFCNHPNRTYSTTGFVESGLAKLTDHDAMWFMRAIDDGLVKHEHGYFHAPESRAKEQIFWEGRKSSQPRRITLWLEPIITVGTVARLHHEFQWPIERIGMQSQSWAFDLIGYGNTKLEELACEVKKTKREIDHLLATMQRHAVMRTPESEPAEARERNAYRKVKALRKNLTPLFWALGPGGYGSVWRVDRAPDGDAFSLVAATESDLRYRNA